MIKIKLLHLLVVAAAAMTALVASAQTTVVFDATTDKGPSSAGRPVSVAKEGITIECSYGHLGDGVAYRFYQGSTLKITVDDENVVLDQIVFTGGSSNPVSNIGSPSSGTYSGGTWTASAASPSNTVSFTLSAQARASKVSITYHGAIADDPTPTLTPAFTFWPEMDAPATASVTINVPASTKVYYTTDGSTPSATHGTAITTTTSITIGATTTVSAIGVSGDNTSAVVSATYTLGTTVTSIAELKATGGEEVRLYWSDEANARVLYAADNQAFVRDNTGAICMYGLQTGLTELKANDHLAGWIFGKLSDYYGLPEFVGTARTNGYQLLAAAPVTEEAVAPRLIDAAQFDDYIADWVTIHDLRMKADGTGTHGESEISVYNRFNVGQEQYYTQPYANALVDMSGIAIAYNDKRQIAPIYQNGVRPVVYVVSDEEDFYAPTADMADVTVRLHRTLAAGQWGTITLPFVLDSFDGQVAEYTALNGDEMAFTTTTGALAARTPYLVKPDVTTPDVTITGVTLVTGEPLAIAKGNYVFRGTYVSATLAQDGTQLAVAGDGSLVKSTSAVMPTYAFVTVPVGIGKVYLSVDGTRLGDGTLRGDVNGDGVVSGADVTALYGQLLDGKTAAGNADVSGDGIISGADVTALYNILLNQ